MTYKYRIQFRPLGGSMLYRDKRSVLLGMLAMGRQRFTDLERVKMTGATQAYFHSIAGDPGPLPRAEVADEANARALVSADFGESSEAPLFKYVSNQTWAHIERGSFQLGSPACCGIKPFPAENDLH